MVKVYVPFESINKETIASGATEKDIVRARLELEIPDENFLINVVPNEPEPIQNLEEATLKALENPVCGPKFSDLLRPKKSVVIITDNQFRPTPTARLLKPIIDLLEKAGIEDVGIAIGGMMVSHEVPMTQKEIKQKLGAENVERIEENGWEIWQNEPRNPDANKFIGFTSAGTPVWVNKKLMRYDVKFGLPLTQAHPWGYGGWRQARIGYVQ